jgi:SSS family transporter
MMKMGFIDWTVLVAYTAILMAMALYISKGMKAQVDIFLAGRSMKKWPIALSMYMALFSTNSFLGVVGWVNQEGGTIWIGLQNLGMMMVVPFVIWLYPALFYKLNITTAYEYLEKRFNYPVRALGSALFLGARTMWLSTMLYAGSLVISIMGGLTPEFNIQHGQVWTIVAIGFLGAFVGVAGGMRAVIWLDVVQFFVLMGSVLLMSFIAVSQIGGVDTVLSVAKESAKFDPPSFFSLTDNLSIVSGLLLGMVSMLSSTGSDQVVLQTYLTAKSSAEVKQSLKLNGFLIKPLSLLIPVLGVIIFAYYKINPEVASELRVSDDALPVFILHVMPAGALGLCVAAIMSALLTSLNSGMTAMSAVVQIDYVKRWRKKPLSESDSVLLGRALILLWGILTIVCALWIRQLGTSNNIIQILNIVMYPFSGVLLGIFLLGLLTKRANGNGALIGAIVGFLITIFVPLSKFVLVNILHADSHDSSAVASRLIDLSKISNFYYGALGVLMTIIIGYATSFLFKPIPNTRLKGLVRTDFK